MQYRTMGASDLEISAIGFGCWEMGGNQYGDVDDGEEIRAVHRAIDLGVTLFDTAAIYGHGHSEEVLGKALGARRKEIVLVTKGGLSWEVVGGPQRRDSSRAAILRDMDDSLRRLGTDHIDLYLIHWPDPATPIEETMGALNDLVQAGKTRYIGVSNYSAAQLRAAKAAATICANQVGYNLFDRRWEREMFPTALALGVGVMAYGPMAHGLLTGAFTTETTFVKWDWRSRGEAFGQHLFTPENFPRNVAVADRLQAVAARLETTLPLLALAWVLQQPAVSVALAGIRKPEEIEQNIGALAVRLSPDDLGEIEEIMADAAGRTDTIPV